MKSFKIWEVKPNDLLNPMKSGSIHREEVIIKAVSRFEALKQYAGGSSSKIYFKGNQPYYSPYFSSRYIALLHK